MTKPVSKTKQGPDTAVRASGSEKKGLMTRRELSSWLSVSERTIARLTADPSRGFPVLVVGRQIRFDPDEVKAWMRREAVRTLWPGRAKGIDSDESGAPDASPEVQAIASVAPDAFQHLVRRVDQLVDQVAVEAGIAIHRELVQRGGRLVYKVDAEGRGSARTMFAAIDRIAARPSRGMRVRVLLEVERGAEWAAPTGWKKAGSGHWIMASIKADEPLDDVADRVAESLTYVLRKAR